MMLKVLQILEGISILLKNAKQAHLYKKKVILFSNPLNRKQVAEVISTCFHQTARTDEKNFQP